MDALEAAPVAPSGAPSFGDDYFEKLLADLGSSNSALGPFSPEDVRQGNERLRKLFGVAKERGVAFPFATAINAWANHPVPSKTNGTVNPEYHPALTKVREFMKSYQKEFKVKFEESRVGRGKALRVVDARGGGGGGSR